VTHLLQDLVTRRALHRPGATALVLGRERMTYGELEASSNRLARLLAEAGCRRGDRVGLLLPKTPAAIASMLAVLKADCAYVPLDVASPAPRLAKIVESADPRLLLAATPTARVLEKLREAGALGADGRVGWIDGGPPEGAPDTAFVGSDAAAFPAEQPSSTNDPGDAAHILFTSGSTGVPKGVVITHANVRHFVEWATAYFGIGPSDRISGHPPLHFDLSTFDIYGALSVGAELHLVPPELNLLAQRLADFIRRAELTQWFSVPSAMAFMAKFGVVAQDDFPSLQRVLWCGEVLPTPVLRHWMLRLPHARFTNLYGPTETTIASSYFTVPEPPADETGSVPIGTACPGEELAVLGDALEPVPVGETGELYIGGAGMSPGYWRDDEKTRAAFLADPRSPETGRRIYRTGDLARVDEAGLVHFLGRADSQIKSRGYRIELGEIEAALNALEGVGECAVVAVDSDGFEGKAICCAYASAAGLELQPPRLREQLAALLPTYMLPSRWRPLDALPKNVNGKIDRPRLRELFAADAR